MKVHTRREHWLILLMVTVLLWTGVAASCSLLQPDLETVRQHPWVAQPVRAETKAYFCQKLGLPSDHPVCQAGKDVLTVNLLHALQQRFPINQTPYSEAAEVLKGYPVETEESKLPDGTVTSKTYVYLLTEFDGFCIYFDVSSSQSEIVKRIDSSNPSGSGPTPDLCGSAKLRVQPRPWLK